MPQGLVTVSGFVPLEEIGITDAHSHVWIDAVAGADPSAPVLNETAPILEGLAEFRAAGGSTIIDCQPPNCGRDANHLRELSTRSGVHLVACTGFHLRRYYANDAASLWQMSAQAACDFFVDEIRAGLTETRSNDVVHPGFIKIAAEATLADSPLHLFEAAAYASRETGCAIQMHTERGAGIEDFVAFFAQHGLPPEKLILCHVDKRPDVGLHREMIGAGYLLEYDTFFRPKYAPEQHLWTLIPALVVAGGADGIALATDMAGGEWWPGLGGSPGPAAFLTQIKPRLDALGLDAGTLSNLMGGNIARRLAVASG